MTGPVVGPPLELEEPLAPLEVEVEPLAPLEPPELVLPLAPLELLVPSPLCLLYTSDAADE